MSSTQKFKRAIVLGGSVSGMLAARVLSDFFNEVVIVEKDVFPVGSNPRKGVPQSAHLHVFLMRGQQILENFFPGILQRFAQEGAALDDQGKSFIALKPSGWTMRREMGLTLLPASRPLIDFCILEYLKRIKNIQILESTAATGICLSPDRKSISGVMLENGRQLNADWVIDCTGRRSQLSQWLKTLNFEIPPEEVINSHLGYASRIYQKPEKWPYDWKGLIILPEAPLQKRGGVLFPIEGNRMIATLTGVDKDYPPHTLDGFSSFVDSLPTPLMKDALQICKPISEISVFRMTESRKRNYHLMKDFPNGLLLLGDAACCFNPYYGQGLTMACLGALSLQTFLKEKPPQSKIFLKCLSQLNANTWFLVTVEDFKYPGTIGQRPSRSVGILHQFLKYIDLAGTTDFEIARTFLCVYHMIKTPTAFLHPRVIFGVIRAMVLNWFGPKKSILLYPPVCTHSGEKE